jgi:hypothetical protein
LSKVRVAAAKPVCSSNLRQIGMLLHAYARDNRGELPAVYRGFLTSRGGLPRRSTPSCRSTAGSGCSLGHHSHFRF